MSTRPDETKLAAAELSAKAIPQTPRGRRTREALVGAARQVFERDGYLEARVTDIAAAAGVAHGTFYTYFASKEEVFLELAVRLLGEMLGASPSAGEHRPARTRLADPYRAIERANRRYLESYRRNAKLMGIIEHVAMFNAELGVIREARARSFSDRAARSIAELQAAGLADPDLNPRLAATALTSMVSRFAYVWFVDAPAGGVSADFDHGVDTLTRLWANAIGLTERL